MEKKCWKKYKEKLNCLHSHRTKENYVDMSQSKHDESNRSSISVRNTHYIVLDNFSTFQIIARQKQ